MAQRFLDQLPKMPNGLLPNGTECMICKEEYGTVPSDNGNIEHAVILPCLHHVGSECIAIWLSPDNGLGNSCPLCRTVFFPIRVREYDDEDNDDGDDDDGSGDSDSDSDSDSDGDNDHDNEERNQDDGSGDSDEEEKEEEDDDDGDEGDEGHEEEEGGEDGSESDNQRERNPMTLLDAFQRVASYSASTHAPEETQREDGQWFERWPLPTAEQIETNEKRARLQLLRPPPPSIFPQPSTSQTTHSPPADPETEITRLASAYRTMAFRETLLYIKLTDAGSRMPPLRSPHNGADLSPHQEEMLLWELGQRGAFTDARARPGYMGMTNRQSWNAHRAKGEVFTYEGEHVAGRGYWSTEVGFGIGGI